MTKEYTDSDAPEYLSAESREWWTHVRNMYELEPHHVHLLSLACTALDRASEARKALEADGLTILNRFGETRPHPAVKIELDCMGEFRRLLSALDLDPAEEPKRIGRPLAFAQYTE